MGSKARSLVLGLMAQLAISSSCGGNDPTQPSAKASPTGPVTLEQTPAPVLKEWAFLFYDDAEFSNAFDPLNTFRVSMAANSNLHVVVLRDTTGGSTEALYIDKNHQDHRVADFGELSMSDPSTFRTFARFAQRAFPARRYIVAYYDHGFGWAGCCMDTTAGPSERLSMHEIRMGLEELGHVDAVLFTAPCLMGAVESAYELREVADVYVGSEEYSGFVYWMGTPLTWLRDTLNQSPEISALDLANGLVQHVRDGAPLNYPQYAASLTMSAVEPARLPAVRSALDELTRELRDGGRWADLDAAATDVQRFGDGTMVDLLDLMQRLAASPDGIVRKRAAAVATAVEAALIASAQGGEHPGSHGLTILLPRAANQRLPPDYRDPAHHLDFAADAQWDELMLEHEARTPVARTPWSAHSAGDGFSPRP